MTVEKGRELARKLAEKEPAKESDRVQRGRDLYKKEK